MRYLSLVCLLVACGGNGKKSDAGKDPEPVPTAPTPAPAPAPAPAPTQTPQELYASCQDHLEGAQADGECKTDADCGVGGCGKEICTTAAKAAEGVMGACVEMPCYKVVDSCGCHEGKCTWTLKATVPPAPAGGNSLPPTLPPTPAPAPGH
jgi:eight-cysteine-cluster-containing protein